MIDLYCERVGSGLWAEPINALSNISFFLAAWASWYFAHRMGSLSLAIRLLISLLIAIGIGSSLFHTLATPFAKLLDSIPIAVFQIAYLWVYSRQVIKLKSMWAVFLVVLLLISIIVTLQFKQILNGSIVYAPGILTLLGLGLYHWQQKKRDRFLLLAATGIFLLALFFRTIDLAICPYWKVGTHFLWHLLNGVLLFFIMKSLIQNYSGSFQIKCRQ
ncbi:MAG: ceramidase domain-containing protein [Xenococcus sp. MO_188.B8]|nr:ceramidase domain-containing protein [Xenococcus sp. MO_188.B8]